MKLCPACKVEKEDSEFFRRYDRKHCLESWCKSCKRALHRRYVKKNFQREKERWLVSEYKMTLNQYTSLLQSQNNRCAICLVPAVECTKALSVDHSHQTGKIRGLLCSACNHAIGLLKDSTESLKRAITYLEDSSVSSKILPHT